MRDVVDPSRKRKIRLVIALSVAVVLAVALIYTSFSASTQAKEPSQILSSAPGTNYQMTGKVVPGSIKQSDNGSMTFEVKDREGEGAAMPVSYHGSVPDPFRGGREIILTGAMQNGTFVGEPESLITKCPSKFTTNASESASSAGNSGSNG
jgi:cytochrome c-type biogenesis protein CcmE